jgi:hypothetical protein
LRRLSVKRVLQHPQFPFILFKREASTAVIEFLARQLEIITYIMATTINNGDIQALLDSFYQLSANIDQRFANMGQQITDLQHQRQPAPITTTSTATNSGTSWRAADIGFFYPDMPSRGDVINKEDKVYYRSVYAFTNRLKVVAQAAHPRDRKKLSQDLDTCFRGEALHWWSDELDTLTRRGLVHADTMDEWSQVLEKRFKTSPDHGTFVRNHPAPGQNPLQETTKNPEQRQFLTTKQPLLLT